MVEDFIDGFYLMKQAFYTWKLYVTGKSKFPPFFMLVSDPATDGYLQEYNVPWRKW